MLYEALDSFKLLVDSQCMPFSFAQNALEQLNSSLTLPFIQLSKGPPGQS